jgi:hypothetical protein
VSAVQSFDVYRDLGDDPENPWSFPTHAAVGPEGQIIVRHLTPGRLGEIGDVPIRAIDGYPVLAPIYAKRGWVLYEDLCFGRVPGVDADMQAWERWQAVIKLRAASRDIDPRVSDAALYHPEVTKRRAQHAGTLPVLSVAELERLLPGVKIGKK